VYRTFCLCKTYALHTLTRIGANWVWWGCVKHQM